MCDERPPLDLALGPHLASAAMASIVEAALIALPPATVEPREVIDVSHQLVTLPHNSECP